MPNKSIFRVWPQKSQLGLHFWRSMSKDVTHACTSTESGWKWHLSHLVTTQTSRFDDFFLGQNASLAFSQRRQEVDLACTINQPLIVSFIMAHWHISIKESIRQYSPNHTISTIFFFAEDENLFLVRHSNTVANTLCSVTHTEDSRTAQLHGSCDFLSLVKRILIAVLSEVYWLTECAKNKSAKKRSLLRWISCAYVSKILIIISAT